MEMQGRRVSHLKSHLLASLLLLAKTTVLLTHFYSHFVPKYSKSLYLDLICDLFVQNQCNHKLLPLGVQFLLLVILFVAHMVLCNKRNNQNNINLIWENIQNMFFFINTKMIKEKKRTYLDHHVLLLENQFQ